MFRLMVVFVFLFSAVPLASNANSPEVILPSDASFQDALAQFAGPEGNSKVNDALATIFSTQYFNTDILGGPLETFSPEGGFEPPIFKTSNGIFVNYIVDAGNFKNPKQNKAVFSLRRDAGSNNMSALLLYMTNEAPISFALFNDAFRQAIMLTQASEKLDMVEAKTYIQTLQAEEDGTKLQRWFFYDKNNVLSCIVKFTPDGLGGTNFIVAKE